MPDEKNTFFEDYQAMMLAVEALKKDTSNPFFKSKYVQLKDVLAEVKKVCSKHNFIFYQAPMTVYSKDETLVNSLETFIQHKSGEKILGRIQLVAKDMTDPQKLGGSITYMRRYSLTTMFGIEEQDDDGNASANNIKGVPDVDESIPF